MVTTTRSVKQKPPLPVHQNPYHKTYTSSISKTNLKPRTRPPQFLNHSPFGWSWTYMSSPAMPWQQQILTSPSNPNQTDLSLSLSKPYQIYQTKIPRPYRDKFWAEREKVLAEREIPKLENESVAVWFEIRNKFIRRDVSVSCKGFYFGFICV